MQIKRDFTYHYNLNSTVIHALLHLLCQVAASSQHVPVEKRNAILIRYLKPKLKDKALSGIKKEIKLMLNVARKKGGNLELKLYELNKQSRQVKLEGAEMLYNLLIYLFDEEGLKSRLFEEGSEAEAGVLYLIEEQIEHNFDENHQQVAPLSLLIQLERAPELISSINQHGYFIAEMKEWNSETHQAHIVIHPSR